MNYYFRLYYTLILYRVFYRYKNHPMRSSKPRCFIFLAADYGNLGDVAITFAQKEFLRTKFPGYDVIEIPAVDTQPAIHWLKRSIEPQDIITIVGGGNMGDMYGDIELHRLMVVESFTNNRIVLFPQTIDYSNSLEAQWLLKYSQKVYGSHDNLLMMAREQVSYQTMKRLYPTVSVRLTPDIVMTLDQRISTVNRKNIVTCCMRSDGEKADNDLMYRRVIDIVGKKGLDIQYYDTHIGGDRYDEFEKYSELEKLWIQFRTSKLVVTDRLHGMIFAFITGTPAIVFRNSNFKVKDCFRWIKECGYIHLAESEYDLRIEELLTGKHDNFANVRTEILKAFDSVI